MPGGDDDIRVTVARIIRDGAKRKKRRATTKAGVATVKATNSVVIGGNVTGSVKANGGRVRDVEREPDTLTRQQARSILGAIARLVDIAAPVGRLEDDEVIAVLRKFAATDRRPKARSRSARKR